MYGTDKQDDWTSRREPEGKIRCSHLDCVKIDYTGNLTIGGEIVE